MKVAVFSSKLYDETYFNQFNQSGEIELVYFKESLNPNSVRLASDFDAICVFVNDIVDAEILKMLKEMGIGLIALRCAGFNNVDIAKANELDIKIVRVPAYSPEAVAEHAVALILTLNRKTHKAYNRVREGNFSLEKLTGFNLADKTVGVIGTGKIGAAFCKIMQGFSCKVLAYDKYPNKALADTGVEYVEVDDLMQQSDIISLHCPLNEETKHIINKHTLKEMKNGVMLINTSRGGLINTKHVVKALKHKKVGFLGIDVYEQEENLFFEDLSEDIIQDELIMRLISFPNVVITSHQAFLTKEALEQIATTTLNNILDHKHGLELKNAVN